MIYPSNIPSLLSHLEDIYIFQIYRSDPGDVGFPYYVPNCKVIVYMSTIYGNIAIKRPSMIVSIWLRLWLMNSMETLNISMHSYLTVLIP